ncbi:hypothetical protein [Mesorhizobium sp. M7A.F.Ca.MR.148.00.0.0]|uniref:hypothetical protein n=1 Tax=Mesorhizobium sp. M7A.F.Ca.MR.148.00.0.0 TaxID=2496775 RepID=UPI000FCB8AAF|nr:hypothetical protein [Mesorhizobium sp. M7A.F.Ca.MR.148.00.0.0]RUV37516.1 hypothetical protein EOB49_11240 [Mesorhizobium sp. M7A.F.Ca.MR.148.00.0.0]
MKNAVRRDAYEIALLLKAKSRELRQFDLHLPFEWKAESPQWPNPPVWVVEHRLNGLVSELREHLDALNRLRREEHFDALCAPLQEGEFWSLGTIAIRLEQRPIHLGFLEPTIYSPFVISDENLVAYLITVSGDDHPLKREHHDHFGWHYHYLDRKMRRSDVILCWDTFAKVTDQQIHPLFYENHAEGSCDFPARPTLWADRKRKSMHEACRPDLRKWPINEFKSPGKTSLAVWPLGAVITPKPMSGVSRKQPKAKSGGRKRR